MESSQRPSLKDQDPTLTNGWHYFQAAFLIDPKSFKVGVIWSTDS